MSHILFAEFSAWAKFPGIVTFQCFFFLIWKLSHCFQSPRVSTLPWHSLKKITFVEAVRWCLKSNFLSFHCTYTHQSSLEEYRKTDLIDCHMPGSWHRWAQKANVRVSPVLIWMGCLLPNHEVCCPENCLFLLLPAWPTVYIWSSLKNHIDRIYTDHIFIMVYIIVET